MPGVLSSDWRLFEDPCRCTVEGRSSQLAAAALLVSQSRAHAPNDKNGQPGPLMLQCIGDVGINLLRASANWSFDPEHVGSAPEDFVRRNANLQHDLEEVGLPTNFMLLEAIAGPHLPLSSHLPIQQNALANACTETCLDLLPRAAHGYRLALRQMETQQRQQGESRMLTPRVDTERNTPTWFSPYVQHGLRISPWPATPLGERVWTEVNLPPCGSFAHQQQVDIGGVSAPPLLFFALEHLWVINDKAPRPAPEVRDAQTAIQAFFVLLLVEIDMQARVLLHKYDPEYASSVGDDDRDRDPRSHLWQRCLLDSEAVKGGVEGFARAALIHHAREEGDDAPFLDFRTWILGNLVVSPSSPGGRLPDAGPGSAPWNLAARVVDWLEGHCLFPNLETTAEQSNPARPKRTELHQRILRAFRHVGVVFLTPWELSHTA
ncbi:hypothetical protein JCM11641_003759 [Rhodosporidiobolus odoratus]